MRVVCACLMISVGVWAHCQTVPKSDGSAQSHLSIADFGLAYPLSNDWIRATELLRSRVESSTPAPNFGRDSGYSRLDQDVAPKKRRRIRAIHRAEQFGGERGALNAGDSTAGESEGVQRGFSRSVA